MFIVTVNHNCKADMIAQAIDRIDGNGQAMARVPGFLFRYRLRQTDDEKMILTVTGWDEATSYQRWLEIKKTMPDEGISPYVGATSAQHIVDSYVASHLNARHNV